MSAMKNSFVFLEESTRRPRTMHALGHSRRDNSLRGMYLSTRISSVLSAKNDLMHWNGFCQCHSSRFYALAHFLKAITDC